MILLKVLFELGLLFHDDGGPCGLGVVPMNLTDVVLFIVVQVEPVFDEFQHRRFGVQSEKFPAHPSAL